MSGILFQFDAIGRTVMLTGAKTYGKKQFAVTFKGKRVLVLNLWGFGLWIFEKGLI